MNAKQNINGNKCPTYSIRGWIDLALWTQNSCAGEGGRYRPSAVHPFCDHSLASGLSAHRQGNKSLLSLVYRLCV